MAKDATQMNERDMVNYRVEALAKKAFSAAYKDALDTEEGVTAVIDGVLYQVFKDGTKKKIKDIPPKIKLDLNKEYTLKA
jgi:hypothetical protein